MFKNKKMVILTVVKGLLSIAFAISALGFLIVVSATIITLLIGMIGKEYKYFKISLKVLGWVGATLLGSVLLYAIMIFLQNVLVG